MLAEVRAFLQREVMYLAAAGKYLRLPFDRYRDKKV
jgi:hypothetical protein